MKFRFYNKNLGTYIAPIIKDEDGNSIEWVGVDNTGVYLYERYKPEEDLDLISVTDLTEEVIVERMLEGVKDEDGEMMFVGDIIQYNGNDEYIALIIEANNGIKFITEDTLEPYNISKENLSDFKIIGNINENPELFSINPIIDEIGVYETDDGKVVFINTTHITEYEREVWVGCVENYDERLLYNLDGTVYEGNKDFKVVKKLQSF